MEVLGASFIAVMLTGKENFPKLHKYAAGKYTKAKTERIRQNIDRLNEDQELYM